MTQLPEWLVYAGAIATVFSGIVVGIAGIVFSILQLRFANGQPKRDLEAHQRALRAAKQERLIGDFAIILRYSIALKEYIRLQNVEIVGKDHKEPEKLRLDYLHGESDNLTLALARARLEGVDEEINKIFNEQGKATADFVSLNELLFDRIDKHDGSDLTFLSKSVKEARALAIQKCEEIEAVLKKKLDELENPKAL